MKKVKWIKISAFLVLISLLLNFTGILNLNTAYASPTSTNIAPLAIASTSFPTNMDIKRINDGIDTSDWSTTTQYAFPQYVTLDFGEKIATIDKISMIVHYAKDQGFTKFDVEYWNGSTWITAKANIMIAWATTGWTYEEQSVDLDTPIITTRVRLKMTGANRVWGNSVIDELKLWGTVAKNIAPMATVSTTFTSSYPISQINDGVDGTPWASVNPASLPKYITFDFNGPIATISKLSLVTNYSTQQGVTKFDVEYFEGGVWKIAKKDATITWTLAGAAIEEKSVVLDNPIKATMVRLKVTGANLAWGNCTILELKLWGSVPSIVSVETIYSTVNKGTTFTFPKTTTAVLEDGSVMNANVKWTQPTVMKNETGSYEYLGTVNGWSVQAKLILNVVDLPDGYETKVFEEDTTSIIKNPAMGWAIYFDQFGGTYFPSKAEDWWKLVDPYIGSASIVYIRVPWGQLEPEEGKYAWIYDQSFKDFIQAAKDRGLKLGIRVFVHSGDTNRDAAPLYVKDAGAAGYYSDGYPSAKYWTPYVYDPIFQAKFTKFTEEFAKEFNDPGMVDFVDAQGLGLWGEMHNISLSAAQQTQVFKWITDLYMRTFDKVLLGDQYGPNSFSYALHDSILADSGWIIRRDSYGRNDWLPQGDIAKILSHWPVTPVFAESAHQLNWKDSWSNVFPDVRSLAENTLKHAYETHSNTLDLRNPGDAKIWVEQLPDLVQEFAIKCGYRFSPTTISYPTTMTSGEPVTIYHEWKNEGVGKLPNNCNGWDYKYKLAFALLDKTTGAVVKSIIADAEVSEWLKGSIFAYTTNFDLTDVSEGAYDFAVSIIDTQKENLPAINLAVQDDKISTGWYKVGDVSVNINSHIK